MALILANNCWAVIFICCASECPGDELFSFLGKVQGKGGRGGGGKYSLGGSVLCTETPETHFGPVPSISTHTSRHCVFYTLSANPSLVLVFHRERNGRIIVRGAASSVSVSAGCV
jgi:hypothetical protein